MPADDVLPELIRQLKTYTSLPLICKPNAGRPMKSCDGTCAYPVDAHRFADILLRCADAGVNLIGGCCGTTPQTIAAVAQRLGHAEEG